MAPKPPRTKPTALLSTAGKHTTGPNELAIIQPLVGPGKLRGKIIQTWRRGSSVREKTVLESGLIIIQADVCYILPDDIPFLPLFADIN
jgi:hypothetical protein